MAIRQSLPAQYDKWSVVRAHLVECVIPHAEGRRGKECTPRCASRRHHFLARPRAVARVHSTYFDSDVKPMQAVKQEKGRRRHRASHKLILLADAESLIIVEGTLQPQKRRYWINLGDVAGGRISWAIWCGNGRCTPEGKAAYFHIFRVHTGSFCRRLNFVSLATFPAMHGHVPIAECLISPALLNLFDLRNRLSVVSTLTLRVNAHERK